METSTAPVNQMITISLKGINEPSSILWNNHLLVGRIRYPIIATTVEKPMTTSEFSTIIIHAFIGWALCTATLGIGMAFTSLDNALILHAIAAPIFFVGVSLVYFRKLNYTTPLQTAEIFLVYAIGMDLFVVALLINHSLAMFTSLLGTWIPFALIFASTWLTGTLVAKSRKLDTVAKTGSSEPG